MGSAIEVTDDTFESTITDNKLVLVDFWAPWCGPCRMVAPVLDEIAGEHGDKVTIAKVNTDENQAVASKHGIMSIPTMMLFKDGEKIDQMVGARRVFALHLNDSKGDLGSHLDRHMHIGEGLIGKKGFEQIINDSRFGGIPKMLETPKENDMDRKNLALLKRLANNKAQRR